MANSAAQDEYYPIRVHRTDSTGYANLDHNALNQKEDQDIQQLERWEVILGGHLANQLAPIEEKRQFKLDGLPKGYELRCAIRKDGGRDYYLYGHPAGPKATYRTPGDFVMHLVWLASGSNDRSDCSCDLCGRMVATNGQRQQLNPVTEAPSAAIRLQAQAQAQAQALAQAHPQAYAQAQAQAQIQQAQAQAYAQQQAQAKAEAQSRGQPQTQVQPQQAQPPIQQPQFQNQQPQPQHQQQPPQQPQGPFTAPPPGIPGVKTPSNVFRLGEMVWYRHMAWRLGVIISIDQNMQNVEGDDSEYTFNLAPLGHRSLNLKPQPKQAKDMRPFLTFSVPDISIQGLVGKKFHEINWQAFALQSSGNNQQMQMVGLEASKMAARSINDSFSTFNLISQGIPPHGLYFVQNYQAVYFGAEMICINDPIRVTPDMNAMVPDSPGGGGGSSAIMLVSEIQVINNPNEPHNGTPSLSFRGNVYRFIRGPLPSHPPNVVTPETLGPVFTAEVAIRNQIELDKSIRWGWVLTEENAVRSDADVQGRFYVTHKLMHVVDPDKFQDSAKNGVIEEAQAYLNSRAQSGNKGMIFERKKNRADALGDAVSVQFVPPEGMLEN